MPMSSPRLLSAKPPTDGDDLQTALHAVYNWEYGSELDELRTLYAKGLDLQWIAARELPWATGIDRDVFARTFSMFGVPFHRTRFWTGLPEDKRWDIARRGSAWMLSNFLHGEQGALMVAAQLVNAVPHMDGKFYAATQTLDEARHVEVFAKYIELLDRVHPIAPSLKTVLDKTLAHESWLFKCIGMQIVVEGLALFTFRDMRDTTEEPLLKRLLTYVARDEARHTAYGIKYLGAVVPTLSDAEQAELEDFAFEASRLLIDSRSGTALAQAFFTVFTEAGVDPGEAFGRAAEDRAAMREAIQRRGGRLGPVSGFVIPSLGRIGLFSDRIASHFRDLFDQNQISAPGKGDERVNPVDVIPALPDDLEAWVLAGA